MQFTKNLVSDGRRQEAMDISGRCAASSGRKVTEFKKKMPVCLACCIVAFLVIVSAARGQQDAMMRNATVKVQDVLNVRDKPSTDGNIAGQLQGGTKVIVIEINDGSTPAWMKIKEPVKNIQGWVRGDFLAFDDASQPVKDTATPGVRHFVGTIGDSLAVQMNLRIQGNDVSGTYFYEKYKTDIPVKGTADAQGNVTFNEFDKGNIVGIFKGTIAGQEMQGQWSKPDGSKTLPFAVRSGAGTVQAVPAVSRRTPNPSIGDAFAEADQHFTYKGEPIHPGMVSEFLVWISEPGAPFTVSVDVAAASGTNEYYATVQKDESGFIRCKSQDNKTSDGYRWFGRLSDGSHVVYAYHDDGGRMFPRNLFFIKFSVAKGYKPEGESYDRLLMTAVRYAPFDARSTVKVTPDAVLISCEGKAPITLKAPDAKAFSGSVDGIRDGLIEIDKSFTYKGKPIHPGIIHEFEGYLSDSGAPLSVSIDLAAASGSNQYFDGNVEQLKQGFYSVKDSSGQGYSGYHWLGKLADGTHVVSAYSNGGGSGVFEHLYFLQFTAGRGYGPDGTPYDRLVMTAIRWYPLGDRSRARVQVLSDKVVITNLPDGRPPVTLTMPVLPENSSSLVG